MSRRAASSHPRSSATLWLTDGRSTDEAALAQFAHRLSPTESIRYSNFLRPERQRQYLIGRMLLRLAVSRTTALPLDAISIKERAGLGPELVLPDRVVAPSFSLSHSRQWVGCVISMDSPLGLDIEVVDGGRDVMELAQSAYHHDEVGYLQGLDVDARRAAFYRIWTLKEALFKLSSDPSRPESTSPPINTGHFTEGRSPAPVIEAQGALCMQGDDWACAFVEHDALAIAVGSARPLARITRIDVPELS